jgi:hypothetical protein
MKRKPAIIFGNRIRDSHSLSGDFNEEEVRKGAENVMMLINNQDSESLRELP